KTVKETKEARRIGIGWMGLSLIGAICTALIGIAYFQQNPNLNLTDPEAIFIELGQIIFHPFIAGIMLAAILAAVMSTISSQLIYWSMFCLDENGNNFKTCIICLGRFWCILWSDYFTFLILAKNYKHRCHIWHDYRSDYGHHLGKYKISIRKLV